MSTKTGSDALGGVMRYAEAKTHLEAALGHLHSAMAITPWFHLVEPLGTTAQAIANDLATHAAAFEDAIRPRLYPTPEDAA